MKLKHSITALALTTIAANAASVSLLNFEDAVNFSHYWEGNEIYDSADVGSEWKNGFGELGAGTHTLTTTGTDLNFVTPAGGANWIEGQNATNGTETLNAGIVGENDPHTVEMRLRLNDTDGTDNGYTIWVGNDGGRNQLTVFEGGITITKVGGGFETLAHDFTTWTTVRLAVDGVAPGSEYVHVWVDGVRLTQDVGNPRTSSSNNSLFVLGDTTSGGAGDLLDVDIDYLAVDTGNAFAPVPEPSSVALLGLGGLALLRRRRK